MPPEPCKTCRHYGARLGPHGEHACMHEKAGPGSDPFGTERQVCSYMRIIGACWNGALWEPRSNAVSARRLADSAGRLNSMSSANERE